MTKAMTLFVALVLAGALSAVSFAQQDQQGQQDQSSQSSPTAQQQQPNSNQTAPPTADQSQDQTPDAQPAQANAFTGTVVKDGSSYVLKTSNMSYQLDDQKKAKRFEGKQVTVTGSLDANTSVIHVTGISPTS